MTDDLQGRSPDQHEAALYASAQCFIAFLVMCAAAWLWVGVFG